MIEWIKNNKKSIIRTSFLVPIILVMVISISHVVSWYDLANPINWAIFLSIAIEIAAMSSISAASVKIKGGVWLIFIIVTLVQFIGNIFYCYNDIDETTKEFKSWVELTGPIFEMLGTDRQDIISQKRWLSLLEGGLLPIISLTSLHFFIKYGDIDENKIVPENNDDKTELVTENIVPENNDDKTELVTENIVPENNDDKTELVTENIVPEKIEKDVEIIPENIEPTSKVNENTEESEKKISEILQINLQKKIKGTDKWG